MFNSLRNRLIFSHILPLLVLIPILGIAIVYFIENQVLLPQLAENLTSDATLISQVISTQPQAWHDPQKALDIIERINPSQSKRVMLLDPNGRILYSTDPADSDRINQILDNPGLYDAQSGHTVTQKDFSERLHGEVMDVMVPVTYDGENIGIIRMTYRYETIMDQILRMRYLIVGILGVGLIGGSILGLVLGISIANPISKVTQAITELASGEREELLPEKGPEEIKGLVHAVNFLADRLHDLEQARRQLLANLVHEIGRPLGALRIAIQVSRKGSKEDTKVLDELLAGMEDETTRMKVLLDDLANLHDQVLGTLELKRENIIVNEWLMKVTRPWQELAHKKHIQWDVNLSPTDMIVSIDPTRLAQALGNLISNAIKFTPSGGTVSITAGEKDEMLWIEVKDTGPGISIEEQKKVFEPFYRGKQKKRIIQGMGLGLSIAENYAAAHGGRIEVDSSPGRGSAFTIWIPKKISDIDRDKK